MGLRLFPTLPTDVDLMSDTGMQDEFRSELNNTSISVLDVEVVRVTPNMNTSSLEPALEFASSVGAQWLAATALELPHYASADEPAFIRSLAAVGETAAKYGMRVMLEFMAFRGISNFDEALRVVRAVGSPNVAITLDVLHFFRSGGAVDSLVEVEPELIGCAQLSDAPRHAPSDLIQEARSGRLYPGEGALPLRELIRTLPAKTPLSVEVASTARSHQSVLRRALDAASWTRNLLEHGQPVDAVSDNGPTDALS